MWRWILGEGGEKRERKKGPGGGGEAYDGADGVFVVWVPSDGHYHWVYISAFQGGGCCDGVVMVLIVVLGMDF